MSVTGRVLWWIPLVALAAGGVGTVHAESFSSKPLTKSQLAQVYKPIELVQFSTSLARVDSVEWLVEQLKLADAIGRDDIVESTLERLFAIEESNPTGLFYQANMYLKRKQPELAKPVFERLIRQAPHSTQAKNLSSIMAIQGEKRADYQRAQLLAKSGRYDEAIRAYKALFPNGMPSPALQLEFLQLQSNLPGSWSSVKQGLERLNANYPSVPSFQLALANHIRKENPADPWILDTYKKLALAPSVGTNAATSWLRALDQLPISDQVVQQYAILASYYPSDMEIQRANQSAKDRWKKEKELRKDPTYLAKLKGLALLEEDKTDQAEAQLRYALTTRPQDPELLGAMGKVYLRRGQQQKALEYFKQAQHLDHNPDSASKWAALIETSQYWAYLDQGDALVDKGQFKQAESAYQKAIQVDKSQPYAYSSLGSLYLVQENYAAAEKVFKQALQLDSSNSSALRGRLDIRIQQQDWSGAEALARSYSAPQQKVVAEKIASIKSEVILTRLRIAIAQNDQATMKASVEELIALQPTSPWLRLDIADVVHSMGDKVRADTLMSDWATSSNDPEMKFAYALYLAQDFNVNEAIAELESIAQHDMTDAMQRNLTRLKLDAQLRDIQTRYLASPESATATLRALESDYQGQIQPLARLVSAWLDIDEVKEAERIFQSISFAEDWSTDDKLAYGSMMVSLNHFEDFDSWYASLALNSATQDLSASEALQFDELKTRRLLSQADLMLVNQQPKLALDLYEQVSLKSEPFKTQAEIGMLQASALTGDEATYHDIHLILNKKRDSLTAAQLMTVAAVFNQQGYRNDANALNQLLDAMPDADALAFRNSMSIAMENQQWALAETRAYQALNHDRMDKNREPEEAKKEPPSLRELYDTADDYWLTRNVKSDIDKLHDRSDGHVIIGWDYSARDGRNTSNQVPIEARIPIESWDGHLLLKADYVSIDSGQLDYYEKTTDSDSISFQNDASGMAFGVGWQAEDWLVDVGTTPIGFDHTTWVGGVRINGDLGELGWTAEASRRPETSSTLSYAGMSVPSGTTDPQGTKWGGVIRTGVKLNSSWDTGGPYGFWSSLQYHSLTGEKVEDNTRLGVLGGAYYKLIATDDQRLSIGTNLMYLDYDKNLGEYTLGHGGYYSPQSYFSVSLPINFYGRYNSSWSYQLSASVSNSWTKEDAPYLSTVATSDKGGGFGTSLQAAVEKRVSKRWYLGALVDVQRSEFYTPNHFMLYAKYTFNDRWQPIEYPPAAPMLYSDF
ncbi:cellulose synthase [Vibrio parahaemolyticus]|uniref:cellulose synthase subunit BcsC-related outer membrane protein n=1 Tax=Vibrio parahaemolyticus TaxID=670 RepID=UPI0011220474|nr:cellulose synthase subunit BcsC-related outer membrane protein [Vibrio parahaemolyticus]TOI18039.1 cellulose synthase [Vibrio parahaemolyticus]HCH2128593.1 BCSC C-terminal domain-containing protein [Vibrio parahaemolyticus]